MVIMSDAEAFGWKLSSIMFGLILLVLLIHGVNNTTIDEVPNVVYDTVTVTDTVTIHDTINHYYPQKVESVTTPDETQDSGIIY